MIERTLTPEQQAVVDADLAGPRLVDAGAGTGKTFTLVARVVSLVRRGILRADEILVVTFTKSAATEIAGRLEAELGSAEQNRPTCGTFHGVASDVLREFAYTAGISPDIRVIDDGRARGVFARAFADLTAGRIAADLSDFPLLERPEALERSLATMALAIKASGTGLREHMARASAAAAELETIEFGGVYEFTPKKGQIKAGWPKPDPARSADERRAEATRERANIAVVAALFARFEHILESEHLLTFGDVLSRATRMLHEFPAIAQTLRARWKHAIVDEFQDTNDAQIGFLEALFGSDLAPVLVVGDVRQAIYEFNGARPQGIVDFRERARECLPLTENRRSLQPILNVAHATLAALSKMDPSLNVRLAAHRGDADPVCVRLESFPDGQLEREAAAVARAIAALVERGVPPRQCAVLLRTRSRARVFAQALRERGLAVQLFGGVGFFEAPEIREVVAWLRLAGDPTDPYAVVAALQSASIGLSDGAVAILARSKDLPRAALLEAPPDGLSPRECERLDRFRRTARVVCGLIDAPLVDAVRSVTVASGAEIARISEPAGLPQVRANLDKLIRVAADFAGDRPLARIADFVYELHERDELELDLPIAEIDGERVSIMTIHGAKGLEWEHVFLADVVPSSFPLVNNDRRDVVARFDPVTGALALKHEIGGRLTLRWFLTHNPHDENGRLVHSDEPKYEEEFRLLYVALTRARDAVYVSGRIRGEARKSQCLEAVETWTNTVSGSSELHRFDAAGVAGAPSLEPPATLALPDVKLALTSRLSRAAAPPPSDLERRGTLSYTAMDLYERCPRRARYQYVFGLPDLGDEAPPFAASDEESARETRDPARYGRVVHRVLESLAKARVAKEDVDIETAFVDALAEENWSPSVTERRGALAAIAAAAAALAPLTPVEAELRFDIVLEGVALGGYIDLIARSGDGAPVVIDYKTGRTPGAHYALQFALYLRAVRDRFPDAVARLLRIGTEQASFEDIVPATEHELLRAVAEARSMGSDQPRPGAQCSFCPYAHDVCRAAPIEPESRVLAFNFGG